MADFGLETTSQPGENTRIWLVSPIPRRAYREETHAQAAQLGYTGQIEEPSRALANLRYVANMVTYGC